MSNPHPNVSLFERKGRRGIYGRVNFNGESWEVKAGDDQKTATRTALLISQDLELVRRGLKSLADVRGDTKKVSPVSLLQEQFERSLIDAGVSEFHRLTVKQRVRDLFEAAGIERLSGDYGRKVLGALVRMRDQGAAAQTLKHYRQAVRQFENWMVQRGHVTQKLIHKATGEMRINVAADRRHRRRAWTEVELRKLLTYLRNDQLRVEKARAEGRHGVKGQQMTPGDRALLYEFAIATMLRAGEIRSLTAASFKLDGKQPHVVLKAQDEKARRGARQPIPSALVPRLKELVARSTGRVFQWMGEVPAKMLKPDLIAAGILYKTDEGVLDFHSFRHSGGAHLVRAGVNVKVVQFLMRHKSINLTLDTYGHLMPGDELNATEIGYGWVGICSPFCSQVQGQKMGFTETQGNTETEVSHGDGI
jgi:integrase